jgi:uncharacterized protein (UPF0332 family)
MIDLKASSLEEPDFAALTTNRQFLALRVKLDQKSLLDELKNLSHLNRLRSKRSSHKQEVRKWMVNGWSTEKMIKVNKENLDGDALLQAVHWVFPQAYYSIYACLQAYLKAKGAPHETHASVRKEFAKFAEQGKYPDLISFLAKGERYSIVFENIKDYGKESSISLDIDDEESVESMICSFLRATRKYFLDEMREKRNFTTKSGNKKERLSEEERKDVSSSVGPTSLIDLIYRKRIKSNYDEIDTFHSDDIDAMGIHKSLRKITSCLNFVHEVYVASIMGYNWLHGVYTSHPLEYGRLDKRMDFIEDIF